MPHLWLQPPGPGDPARFLGRSPEGLGEQGDPGVLWPQSWSCPLGLSSLLCEAEPQNLACVAVNPEHTPGKGLTCTWGFGSLGGHAGGCEAGTLSGTTHALGDIHLWPLDG